MLFSPQWAKWNKSELLPYQNKGDAELWYSEINGKRTQGWFEEEKPAFKSWT